MATTKQDTDVEGFSFQRHTAEIRERVEKRLAALVPSEADPPQQLHRAMRYSLLAGGKRLRPLMTIMAATHLGGHEDLALDPACAIEMVHTASLILDDLPCMDDAVLRRGHPANHTVFGVDTALLAAMALLNRAYAVISNAPGLSPELRLALIDMLSNSVGSTGIIGGQLLDLQEDWRQQNTEGLMRIHGQKTAALFVACAEAGARLAGIPGNRLDPVREFALNLGLAFQTLDDLLDASSSDSAAGKDVGKDEQKATFVSFMGQRRARLLADRFIDAAIDALKPLGPGSAPLAELARSFCAPQSAPSSKAVPT